MLLAFVMMLTAAQTPAPPPFELPTPTGPYRAGQELLGQTSRLLSRTSTMPEVTVRTIAPAAK